MALRAWLPSTWIGNRRSSYKIIVFTVSLVPYKIDIQNFIQEAIHACKGMDGYKANCCR